MGKHTGAIVEGQWNENGLLMTLSKDKSMAISKYTSETSDLLNKHGNVVEVEIFHLSWVKIESLSQGVENNIFAAVTKDKK